jgi:hypothetical protein
MKATDYGTVSANIKRLGCNNKHLYPCNFICCPQTMCGHTAYLMTYVIELQNKNKAGNRRLNDTNNAI